MARYHKSKQMTGSRSGMASWPTLAGLVVGLFLGYLIGEALLVTEMHPLHWVVAVGGASVGYLLGMFCTMKRVS